MGAGAQAALAPGRLDRGAHPARPNSGEAIFRQRLGAARGQHGRQGATIGVPAAGPDRALQPDLIIPLGVVIGDADLARHGGEAAPDDFPPAALSRGRQKQWIAAAGGQPQRLAVIGERKRHDVRQRFDRAAHAVAARRIAGQGRGGSRRDCPPAELRGDRADLNRARIGLDLEGQRGYPVAIGFELEILEHGISHAAKGGGQIGSFRRCDQGIGGLVLVAGMQAELGRALEVAGGAAQQLSVRPDAPDADYRPA